LLRITVMSLLLGVWVQFQELKANALVISNTALTGQNTGNGTWQVRFNIAWENSWRDNINWDAVWVFCKYRVGTGPWLHATLSPTGYQTGSGTPISITVACDQKGAFISRRELGAGNLNTTQVELRWHYSADGVQNSDVPDLNIYGIEMVYIPKGPFTIGDGNGVNQSSSGALYAVSQHLPYTIDEFMSPNISATSNITNPSSSPANFIRIDGDGGLDLDLDGIVDSAHYPTGYNAFYLMKYELTQGQYADFLNALTYAQQSNHVNSTTNVLGASIVDATIGVNPNRNTILVQTVGVSPNTPRVYATARPDRAITHTNVSDMMAYLDWVALRPYTELEFEKACRGPRTPIFNELAWGSTRSSIAGTLTLSGTENGTETIVSPIEAMGASTGNAVNQGDGGTGQLRVGIFATQNTLSRYPAGASYYGVMNLSDHSHEHVVTLGNVAGRSFRGTHGNGILNANGYADVPHWPGASGSSTLTNALSGTNSGSTGTAGLGYKGSTGQVSARNTIVTSSTSRTLSYNLYGTARGARTAFSGEFIANYSNGATAFVGEPIQFSAATAASSFTWAFASGSPSSSALASPSVSWAAPGTYNVSLTINEGTCTSSSISTLTVLPACSSPAVLSGNINWTQNNTTYTNSSSPTSSTVGPRALFDGNTAGGTSGTFRNTSCCIYNAPIWVLIDFGSDTHLNGLGIWSFYTSDPVNYNASGYTLEGGTSLSGPWDFVSSGDISRNSNHWQDFSFSPTSYRYWRITFTNSEYYYVAINELRFNRCN
jgi:formylglycine-generating enzyme required for sulfatase activity